MDFHLEMDTTTSSRDFNNSPSHRLYSEDILISPRSPRSEGGSNNPTDLGYELYTACLHGDVSQVKEICGKLSIRDQKTNAIVNYQLNGWTPLDISIFHKSQPVIEYLYHSKLWNQFKRVKTLGENEFEASVSWFWNLINKMQWQKLKDAQEKKSQSDRERSQSLGAGDSSSDRNTPSPSPSTSLSSGLPSFKSLISSHDERPFIVLLTSRNEEKLRAVTYVIKEHLNHVAIVIPVDVDSGIFHGQPWGHQATYEGASTRIDNALKSLGSGQIPGCAHADYIVSVENGVFAILSHEKPMGQDTACVVIEKVGADNKPTQREFAFSVSRTYPLDLVYEKKRDHASNEEIGQLVKKYYESEKVLHFSRYDQIRDTTRQVLTAFNNGDVLIGHSK